MCDVTTQSKNLVVPKADMIDNNKGGETDQWNKAWPRIDEGLPSKMRDKYRWPRFQFRVKKNNLYTSSSLILEVNRQNVPNNYNLVHFQGFEGKHFK